MTNVETMTTQTRPAQADAELARLAAKGDAAAFEEIHRRYSRLVYNVALRMTGNAADAEDLTQESFISVLRSVRGFRGEAAFATWLYRLAVNQVRMHFRRRRSRPFEQTGDEVITERAAARRACATHAVERIAIERAVETLPPGYRAAFVLHDVAGYEHEEIGRMLGCNAVTSRSQLHRARAKLRAALSNNAPAFQH
jgi:RNA polymerase sigma-70 factor (ECF subfamily)